jgi:hypothetical protein
MTARPFIRGNVGQYGAVFSYAWSRRILHAKYASFPIAALTFWWMVPDHVCGTASCVLACVCGLWTFCFLLFGPVMFASDMNYVPTTPNEQLRRCSLHPSPPFWYLDGCKWCTREAFWNERGWLGSIANSRE